MFSGVSERKCDFIELRLTYVATTFKSLTSQIGVICTVSGLFNHGDSNTSHNYRDKLLALNQTHGETAVFVCDTLVADNL